MTANLPQDNNQPQDQPVTDQKTFIAEDKKVKEAVSSLYKEAEPGGVIEQKEFEIPKEVSGVVKEVKKEGIIELPVPLEDEYGQVLMESARPSKPKIILPLTRKGMKGAAKQRITETIRWLYTWCKRIMAMFPGRVFYKKVKTTT
jgi:hypothetical protein